MLDETSGPEYHSSRRARTVSSRHRSASGCDVPLFISVTNEHVNVPNCAGIRYRQEVPQEYRFSLERLQRGEKGIKHYTLLRWTDVITHQDWIRGQR
jgi:hypothetical protein